MARGTILSELRAVPDDAQAVLADMESRPEAEVRDIARARFADLLALLGTGG